MYCDDCGTRMICVEGMITPVCPNCNGDLYGSDEMSGGEGTGVDSDFLRRVELQGKA